MKFFSLLFLAITFSLTTSSLVQANRAEHRVHFGVGAAFYNLGKTTTNIDGSTNTLGQLFLPLQLSLKTEISSRINLQTIATYTPLAVTASDSVSKRILTTGFNFTYEATPVIDYKAGLGILTYYISGDGSSVTRSNGTGTATFYLPGTTSASRSIYLDFGISYYMPRHLKLDIDALVLNSVASTRSFTTVLSLSKGFF
jgi:hypothetical protein